MEYTLEICDLLGDGIAKDDEEAQCTRVVSDMPIPSVGDLIHLSSQHKVKVAKRLFMFLPATSRGEANA